MILLIAGVLLWSVVHLFPSVLPNARASLIGKLGQGPYRGLFALDIVIALVLIVIGWRAANVSLVYTPPLFGSPVVTALMFISFVLFAAANAPGNIKRMLRHPMLTGTIAWSVAHLLANGDSRSLVLFGGIGLWALISIFTINHRDREWVKPEAVPVVKDAMTIVGSVVIFAIVLFLHPYLFGVSPLPGI